MPLDSSGIAIYTLSMGQLIFKENIKECSWYFEDAHFSEKWEYKWPSPTFPFCTYIHMDDLTPVEKVKIRRWIEQNLQETVIVDKIDNNYHWYYPGFEKTWVNSFQVPNSWFGFYFEDTHSRSLFTLAFSELIKPISKHHPKYPEHEYAMSLTPAERILL